MNKKRLLTVASITGLCICLATSVGFAKFRGGTVYDIQNEIKEAILAAKNSEIYQLMTDYKELQKKMYAPLANIQQIQQDISKSIGSINGFKKYTIGFLNRESKDAKTTLTDAYKINMLNGIDAAALEAEKKRIENLRETEIMQTLTVAKDTSDAQAQLKAEADKIIALQTEGTLSEQQKIAMLKALYAQSLNLKAMAINQNVMQHIADDAATSSEGQITSIQEQSSSMTLVNGNASEIRQQMANNRIKEFPK